MADPDRHAPRAPDPTAMPADGGRRPRVAVIGGGVSGLVCAWLLERRCEVTLFEREERLGGHADTVEVDLGGPPVLVECGFEFFWEDAFPLFERLLRILGVRTARLPTSLTVFTPGERRVRVFPPLRRRSWAALDPRTLAESVQFLRTLHRARPLLEAGDTGETVGRFLRRAGASETAVAGFILPLLQSGWGVTAREFEGFSAFDVVGYYASLLRRGLRPPTMTTIDGGMRAYVAALVRDLGAARVRTGTGVTGLTRGEAGYRVGCVTGAEDGFDHVVLATDASTAARLVAATPAAPALAPALAAFRYFDTTIAVHGDPSLMPARRRHWSLVNVRRRGAHSLLSVWRHAPDGPAVFRSWLGPGEQPPAPLYRLATYRHVRVDPSHFEAQRRLAPLQGRCGLWAAGVHAAGTDCHESAIGSAVDIARPLAPEEPRLARLLAGDRPGSSPRVHASSHAVHADAGDA